jgi:hypothetical protein
MHLVEHLEKDTDIVVELQIQLQYAQKR